MRSERRRSLRERFTKVPGRLPGKHVTKPGSRPYSPWPARLHCFPCHEDGFPLFPVCALLELTVVGLGEYSGAENLRGVTLLGLLRRPSLKRASPSFSAAEIPSRLQNVAGTSSNSADYDATLESRSDQAQYEVELTPTTSHPEM